MVELEKIHQLKKNTEVKTLRIKLENADSLFNTIVIASALKEVIAPYKLWGQYHDILKNEIKIKLK